MERFVSLATVVEGEESILQKRSVRLCPRISTLDRVFTEIRGQQRSKERSDLGTVERAPKNLIVQQ
ncbi:MULTISPECIES: hypothetical protein [Paenibacillus]|uniref:Uncharacterized protein n=1 Tax=Paenibacillus cucumis (ex Kampfer et al. 2016) TaxID=1776858 RepID=A0ABS7KJI5_9BACL|nr:hypothetical protein [Paenibacillus cucumis (ex Kampfer et al. 2016)]MBY0204338.1 hypothetical protein [Paenibacillus cucumis (ex Kampfer et al. 2016)]MDP9699408.1 hypothetical protein [Paenibacillus intestini]